MTYDWECPRCGESRSAFRGCRCAGPGRCVWCGNYPDGYPPCRCEPPCEECGEWPEQCRCVRDLDAEDESGADCCPDCGGDPDAGPCVCTLRERDDEPLADDDWIDREERRREREAQDAADDDGRDW